MRSTSVPLSLNLLKTHLTVSACPSFTEASKSQMFYTAYEMSEGHRKRKSTWFSSSRIGRTCSFHACNLHTCMLLPSQVVPRYNQTTSMVLILQKYLNDHQSFIHIYYCNVKPVYDHILVKYCTCVFELYAEALLDMSKLSRLVWVH